MLAFNCLHITITLCFEHHEAFFFFFFEKFFININYYLVYVEDKLYSQIKRETKLFSIAIKINISLS